MKNLLPLILSTKKYWPLILLIKSIGHLSFKYIFFTINGLKEKVLAINCYK